MDAHPYVWYDSKVRKMCRLVINTSMYFNTFNASLHIKINLILIIYDIRFLTFDDLVRVSRRGAYRKYFV